VDYPTNYSRRNQDMETGDPIPGIHVKALYDELGPTPSGGHGTVTARFEMLEGTLDQKAGTVHSHDASAIVSGVLSPARLGTGTPTQYTVLNGQGQWVEMSAVTPGVIALGPDEDPPPGVPVDTLIVRVED
jgi:hypothetical protein